VKILCNFIAPLIETLVIALHPDVGVDVKSERVEFFWQFFFWWNKNCKQGDTDSENK